MKRKPLAIYGAGHLGRQILHHLTSYYADRKVLGYLDDTQPYGTEVKDGLVTLGSLAALRSQESTMPSEIDIVFAIGYSDMKARDIALRNVLNAGYALFSVIHPQSIIEPSARLGVGAIILAGAIIDQNVSIGAGCYFDIGVRVGEDAIVGDNNYFSSGASLGGSVTVGNSCFFGMDSTVTTGVSVGSNVFVNAKTLVSRKTGDNIKLVELHKTRELAN